MNVDPEVLRRFATELGSVGARLREIRTTAPFSTSENALPGTDFHSACVTSAAAAVAAVLALAGRAESVAAVARGVGQNYEVTELQFSDRLAAMGSPT